MTLSLPCANKGLSAEDVLAHWAFQPKGSRTILHKVVVTKFFHSWHTNFCCHDYEAERIRGTEATYSQGNLDWHGNPSWFSGLQDESNFQTKISHKWLEIIVSFFHVMKIWYSELYLVLVSCYHSKEWQPIENSFFQSLKSWVLFVFRRTWVRKCLQKNSYP